MPITPIIPAPTRLAGNLARGQEVLAKVTTVLDAAGEDAAAFTRCAITVHSTEAVDRLAQEFGVVPRWSPGKTMYVARWTVAGEAEAEAVYYAPASEAVA